MKEPVEILLVEDYEPDAHFITRLLGKNRVTNKLQIVSDGAAALDFVFCRRAYRTRDIAKPPGVVLLDTRLPKVDGWEILRQIKEDPRTRKIPVIIITGSVFEEDLAKGEALGADGCLAKPVRFEALREVLNRARFVWSFAGD